MSERAMRFGPYSIAELATDPASVVNMQQKRIDAMQKVIDDRRKRAFLGGPEVVAAEFRCAIPGIDPHLMRQACRLVSAAEAEEQDR